MDILNKVTYGYKSRAVSSDNLNDIQDSIKWFEQNAVTVADRSTVPTLEEWTDAEKAQARTNIDAAASADVGTVAKYDAAVVSNLDGGGKTIRLGSNGDLILPESAESGTSTSGSSVYSYCKLADGTLIQWGEETETPAIATQWGSWYYGTFPNIVFQYTFAERPSVSLVRRAGQYCLVNCGVTRYQINDIFLYRPAVGDQSSVTLSWIAIGRWK